MYFAFSRNLNLLPLPMHIHIRIYIYVYTHIHVCMCYIYIYILLCDFLKFIAKIMPGLFMEIANNLRAQDMSPTCLHFVYSTHSRWTVLFDFINLPLLSGLP